MIPIVMDLQTGEINIIRRKKELMFKSKYDEKELKLGIKEEMEEHGMDVTKATKTAKDHLREDPKYYSKLKKVMKKSLILKGVKDESTISK